MGSEGQLNIYQSINSIYLKIIIEITQSRKYGPDELNQERGGGEGDLADI